MPALAEEFDFAPLAAPVEVTDPVFSGNQTAEERAAAVLARAEAEAEMLREAARAEGYEAGRAEAMAAVAPASEALQQAALAAQADAADRADRLEGHAVDLALFLAEKVLGGALAVQPERVVETVRGALRSIVERERITILVSPDDLDLVRGSLDEVVGALGGIEHCEVQAERRVGRGGCVVRTVDGDVDARIETKLQRAREVIESALEDGA
jgi:flagellar biosynthesis/type III secretory pathway protein FliH